MAIIPILLAVMLFLSKKQNNFLDLLSSIDISSVMDILKELNIGGEYLNYVTPDMINAFKEGKLDKIYPINEKKYNLSEITFFLEQEDVIDD